MENEMPIEPRLKMLGGSRSRVASRLGEVAVAC